MTKLANIKFDTPGGYEGFKQYNMLQKITRNKTFNAVAAVAGFGLAVILIYNTYLSIKINKQELKKIEQEKESN